MNDFIGQQELEKLKNSANEYLNTLPLNQQENFKKFVIDLIIFCKSQQDLGIDALKLIIEERKKNEIY